jgi:outer membrane immunogenic protein
MKKLLLLAILISLVFSGYARKHGVAPLAKGKLQLNFGTGFTNYGLPAYASLDIALHKDITLTPEVNVKIGNDFHVGALVKADYHWNYLIGIPSKWDFYSGARAGFDVGHSFLPDIGIQVGGRWYFAPKWGLNVEMGGGSGFGTTVGLSMKL